MNEAIIDFSKVHWKCHICGKTRRHVEISVMSKDASLRYNLPEGTVTQNIRYCNDNKECIEGVKKFEFWRK